MRKSSQSKREIIDCRGGFFYKDEGGAWHLEQTPSPTESVEGLMRQDIASGVGGLLLISTAVLAGALVEHLRANFLERYET